MTAEATLPDTRIMPEQRTRGHVLVIDEHRLFAELLSAVLRTQPDLDCVGRAFNETDARRAFATLRPDVVVIDTSLADDGGIGFATDLMCLAPGVRVVLVDERARTHVLRAAARVGICAYLPKSSPLEDILDAIRSSRVGTLIAPTDLVVRSFEDDVLPLPVSSELPPRELEVLRLLEEGLAVQQISRRMGISIHTGRGYVKSLLSKLDAHTQLEAVAIAKRRGLLRSAG
jgi:DNA-binding NarL/FixJ family response regulator